MPAQEVSPEVSPSRPFLVRPPKGVELRTFLESTLAGRHMFEAWITAHGTLAEVEVRDAESAKAFATSSRIVSLVGSAEVTGETPKLTLTATLGRPSLRGLELIAGEIVRARAESMVFMITPLTSRTSNSRADDVERDEPEDDAAAAEPRVVASPWDAVAEASAQASTARSVAVDRALPPKASPHPVRAAATALPAPATPIAPRKKVEIEEFLPEVGDAIEHFAFGRCRVLKSDGEELLVRDESTGKIRTIHL
ncbi:MAG: PCC domain-containing protein, partial [Polyangiales bacterium]